MRKGQKLSKDGVQCLLFPMEYMNITQGNWGTFSHNGVNALDNAGKDGGIDETIAPCDCKVKWIDNARNGNAVFLESIDPVLWADGTIAYASMMFIHDNYVEDIRACMNAGYVFKQGETFGDEGTAGRATGNHTHFEIAKGHISNYYVQNGYGVWQLPNSVQSDHAFFIDGTILMNNGQPLNQVGKAMNWKYAKELKSFSLDDLVEEHNIAIITVDDINIRKDSPKGEIVDNYKEGTRVEYTHKYVGNGHRYVSWKKDGTYYFMAVSGSEEYGVEPWARFEEVSAKPNPKPKPSLTEKVKMYGIDISDHNTNIDLTGQGFVIIRATYGTTEDKWFRRNVEKCQKAKIPFGLYCYSYAINESQMYDEANFFLNAIKGIDIPMGCWFDMEDADNWKVKHSVLTKEHCTRATEVFCDVVSKAGYYVGVYSTPSWFKNYVITDRPKWYAHWGTNDGKVQYDYSKECVLYQYAANPIDKDLCYVDLSELKSNPVEAKPKPEVKPEPKPDPTPAPSEDERLDVKGVNKLVELLRKLVEKILKMFN